MRQRAWAAAAIGLAVAIGLTIRLWPADEATAGVIAPPARTVDPSTPEAKLLNSVLYVDDWREFGKPVGFAYVPKSRPPGLLEIMPGNPPNLNGGPHRGTGNGALLDVYHLRAGNTRIQVVVEFAASPTTTCADLSDSAASLCVRTSKPIRPEPEDIALRRTTAYFTANNSAALKSTEAKDARRFWADVEMVPSPNAAWFTGLVTRAKASVQE